MARMIIVSIAIVFWVLAVARVAPREAAAEENAPGLSTPHVRLSLEGPMQSRLDAIIHNWLVPLPEANPGLFEMMRLRDRQPPYEDPVPWAGEFVGKYLTSCVLACRMSRDERLREVTTRGVHELLATQAEDGYLGPFPDRHLLDRWDLWGHYHCMLALVLWHHDTGDAAALRGATRAADLMCATFLDTDHRVHDAGSHEMNMAVMHILGMLYRETGTAAYLRLLREIELDWQKPPAGDYHRLAASGIEFYQTPKPRWESLHPMAALAELYRITGDDAYRQSLLHWWWSIYRTDIHNTGSFSTNEQAVGNPFQAGAIETCCTVAWLALSVEALQLTADSRIADALEHATWNAVLGHQHPSGRWCTYDTPMNGKRLASAHSIVFQSRPGTPELNCCSVNGPNGLGLLSQWAVLAGSGGLYVNYYGPGKIDVPAEDGAEWSLVQTTDYPATGTIQIEVRPPQATAMPLRFRIPEWSRETRISVNGKAIAGAKAGTYASIERTWNPGDKVTLELDLRVRALRGDHHVEFHTSLLRGPILLTFDQKYNTIEPRDMPELDLASLPLTRLPADDPVLQVGALGPIVAFATAAPEAPEGQRIVLCDFGSAGAFGTHYRSWLPVRNAPPAPFQLQYPEPRAVLPVEDLALGWSAAEPGAVYDLRIARDAQLTQIVAHQHDLTTTEFTWKIDPNVEPAMAGTYYWQVTARRGEHAVGAMNGPFAFTLDRLVETSMRGVVLRAALAGTAQPQEGRLVTSGEVTPAAGRAGVEHGALAFNGSSSKVVYEAPRFPLRTYTFAAWFRPQGLATEGRQWHQIVSAWCGPLNDPLRVSVQGGELVASIEQPGAGHRLSGGRVSNGVWTHVALVKQLTRLTMYVDGQQVGQITVPASFQPGPTNLGIGCNPNFGSTESFGGELADVLFVREALPAESIRELAAAP